jgi:prepilin-type N-terminal cleavage/methylation domain-containing protein
MRKKIRQQKGFTLIEMLIAMAIFVTFTGILISSYTSIVKAQRDANDYRVLYAEARHVFEVLTQEFRDGMVDYGNVSYGFGCQDADNGHKVYLISKDGLSKTKIDWKTVDVDEENSVGFITIEKDGVTEDLNSQEVSVDEFELSITPARDPYDQQYVDVHSYQFHPKVTISATFSKEMTSGKTFSMNLRTSISSRIYNQIYETDVVCK